MGSTDSICKPKFGPWLRSDPYAVDRLGLNRRSSPPESRFMSEESSRMDRTAVEIPKRHDFSEKEVEIDSNLNFEKTPATSSKVTVNSDYANPKPLVASNSKCFGTVNGDKPSYGNLDQQTDLMETVDVLPRFLNRRVQTNDSVMSTTDWIKCYQKGKGTLGRLVRLNSRTRGFSFQRTEVLYQNHP